MNSTHADRAAQIQTLMDRLERLSEEHGTPVYMVSKAEADRLGDLFKLLVARDAAQAAGAPQAAIDAASALWPVTVGGSFPAVVDAFDAAILAEREACATVARSTATDVPEHFNAGEAQARLREAIAAAIRARK